MFNRFDHPEGSVMFISFLAEASTTGDSPVWLVPTITGSAGLVGSLVGGSIAYMSARAADKRKESAEERRSKATQIRDVAARFLRAEAKALIKSHDLNTQAGVRVKNWEELIEKLTDLGEAKADAAAAESRNAAPTPSNERLEKVKQQALGIATAAHAVARGFAIIDPELSAEVDGLIVEMSLLLPAETVLKAEIVGTEVMKRYVSAFLPREKQVDAQLARNAIDAFVNDIRKLLGEKEPFVSLRESDDFDEFMRNALGIPGKSTAPE